MSESQEINVGRRADAEVRKQYHVYENKALQDYVDRVGQRLARSSDRPNLQYHFTVLDSPEINAFALPGGYVYITRGILAYLNSEAELAAVLGHEIGHVAARHGVRQQSAAEAANIGLTVASIFVPEINTNVGQNLSNLLGGALLSGYGREHELEADKLGAKYLARADYDPQAMIKVLSVLKDQELFDAEIAKQEGREPRHYHGVFASHPDNDTRLKEVVGEAKQLTVAHPYEGHNVYLQQTVGLVFNDSDGEGVIRNNKFMHATLGLALTFPQGWHVQNLPSQLLATSPQGEAAIQLKADDKPTGTPADYVRRMTGTNVQLDTQDIHHLPAAIATLPESMTGVVYLNSKAYVIQGHGKSRAAFDANRNEMLAAIRSFHALSAAERREARPLVLNLITARPGDTYARLAEYSPLGKNAESYLRLINGAYPTGEPVPGQLIKTVE
ncbi:MAG: M48 family metalloprotease [Sideroxydans sp.]|nr:M48 family metalloprotease [Sideroxydans sp.]